jgi:chromosome segregation ATPase
MTNVPSTDEYDKLQKQCQALESENVKIKNDLEKQKKRIVKLEKQFRKHSKQLDMMEQNLDQTIDYTHTMWHGATDLPPFYSIL